MKISKVMKKKNIFKILFRSNDKEYDEVTNKLKKIKKELLVKHNSEAVIENIDFIKNEWVTLPEAFGKGVISMGIEASEERKCFLVHYKANSELFTHQHPKNLERIQVLTGYIKDNSNGKVFNEGQTYIIDKNVPHNIVTLDKEAYLFIVFSEKLESIDIDHIIED